MVAPNKARIEDPNRSKNGADYETQSGDMLKAVFFGGSTPGTEYSVAVANLTPDVVNPAIAIADKLDKVFSDTLGGSPIEGATSTSARALVELGMYPAMQLETPAWLAGSDLAGLYAAIKDEARPLIKAAIAKARGAAAAEGKALAANTALWDAAYNVTKAISTLGMSAFYDSILPKYKQLEAAVQAHPENAQAVRYYNLAKPVMVAAAAARSQGLLGAGDLAGLGDLAGPKVIIAALGGLSLSGAALWISLGLSFVVGGAAGFWFRDTPAGKAVAGLGFGTIFLAVAGYYAYKKGYLAKLGLKPKG
jgi:hypothetical protein